MTTRKKLVLEYCQKNFVDKGMIADIAFHDLDSDNPHAHVMLTLKTIGPEGFGKKERSWNDRKMSVLWRESWASMANSYLAAAGSSERIDHRSLQAQHEEALEKAAVALDNEEKALWLAKAAETNRPAMKRIHSAKWRSKAAQEQRAAEQAVQMLPSRKQLKSTKHSANLILKSSLMSEALRLHILLNQKRLYYLKHAPVLLPVNRKNLFWLPRHLILVCVALNLTVINPKLVRSLQVRNHWSIFLILEQILF